MKWWYVGIEVIDIYVNDSNFYTSTIYLFICISEMTKKFYCNSYGLVFEYVDTRVHNRTVITWFSIQMLKGFITWDLVFIVQNLLELNEDYLCLIDFCHSNDNSKIPELRTQSPTILIHIVIHLFEWISINR